jgi:hypothetical protein
MGIVVPYHFKIYRRNDARWFAIDASRVVFNGSDEPLDLENVEQQFGLTPDQVRIELFRINGGRAGYYLANLRDRQYYYCGLEWEDIKVVVRSLGIGRDDPMEDD